MQMNIGKPVEGSDLLLDAAAIAKGLSYPSLAKVTNRMPHHATLGGVYLPVSDEPQEMQVMSGDSLLRFVSDAQQVAFLGGYAVAITVELPDPTPETTETDTTKAKGSKPPAPATKEA